MYVNSPIPNKKTDPFVLKKRAVERGVFRGGGTRGAPPEFPESRKRERESTINHHSNRKRDKNMHKE